MHDRAFILRLSPAAASHRRNAVYIDLWYGGDRHGDRMASRPGNLGAEPVSNPGVKLLYPLYPRIRPASRVPDQVCRVLIAADTSVHEENAARIGAAGMSAQVVVPKVLGPGVRSGV